MDASAALPKSTFDYLAHGCSVLSLIGSVATYGAFLFPPDRGINFITHMYLLSMIFVQLGVFVLFVAIVVLFAGFRGSLRLSRPTAILILVALVAVIAQWFAFQGIRVDGSSVP